MTPNKPTEQSTEQRLKNAVQEFIKDIDFNTEDDQVRTNSGKIIYVTDILVNFAKSDIVKHYHQPDNKAVDLETVTDDAIYKYWKRKNCFGTYLEGLVDGSKWMRGELYPYLSTPQKVIIEVEIDKLADEGYKNHLPKNKLTFDEEVQRIGGYKVGFKEGFQSSQSLYSNQQEEIERLKDLIKNHHVDKAFLTENDLLKQQLSDLQGKMESATKNISDLNDWLDNKVPVKFVNIHPAKKIINEFLKSRYNG